MKRNYIGIASTFHDPALAIVNSRGEVVFAEGSERYLQNKRAINCPADDVNRIGELLSAYCEPNADLVVASTFSGSPLAHASVRAVTELLARLRALFFRKDPGIPSCFSPVRFHDGMLPFGLWGMQSQGSTSLQAAANLQLRVWWGPTRAKLKGANPSPGTNSDQPQKLFRARFNHHLAHAAAACYSSPYREAVCAVLDGFGDWTSTGYYAYENGRVRLLKVPQRSWASLGLLYGFVCLACGFDLLKGEEWKVMGLAPYGKFDDEIYDVLKSAQRVEGLRLVQGRKRDRDWKTMSTLGKYDRADLAFTAQHFFQEQQEEVLCNLAQLGISNNLVLSGGCALNSTANGRILERTPFEDLYVFCAPGDDGSAVGAALLAYYEDNPDAQPSFTMLSPYLGSTISRQTLEQTRSFGCLPNHSSWPGKIHEKAA